MTWLVEEPVWIVAIGGVAAAALAFAWLQTGRRALLYAAAACVVGIVLGLFAASAVITDRETVEALLREAAKDVQNNDLESLLELVHSESPQIRAQASQEFPKYKFDRVSIKSNLQITLDPPSNPQEAVAKFNVVVVASSPELSISHGQAARYVTVTFRKDTDGQWRVYSYEHHDPQVGLMRAKEN